MNIRIDYPDHFYYGEVENDKPHGKGVMCHFSGARYNGDFVDIKRLVGQNIKFYRFKLSLTQEQLAEKTKLSTTSISAIENGKADVRISHLHRIAQALDVDVKNLFDKHENNDLKWRVDLK